MLFDIRVQENEWVVEIAGEDGNVISSRAIEMREDQRRFLIPPKGERDAVNAADPSAILCGTDDPVPLRRYFEAFIRKERSVGDDLAPVVTFGRYLFAALIGTEAWTKIGNRADGQRIELALSWGAGKEDLSAFPWEAMHDGQRFVAEHVNAGIVRRVGGGVRIKPDSVTLSSPPRVLIVVGTAPRNDVILAGVEYVSLIQALKDAELDLALQTFLVLDASSKKLQSAVAQVKPDVVHFICHGGIDPGGAYLQLVDDDDKNRTANKYATPLAVSLQTIDTPLPRVVVITACHSAEVPTSAGQIATPLAADLVKAGVPLVVGMAGRVADQACRLFTRRFYEALLTSGDVTQATAQGRRAAIAGGRTDPKSTVDWALPVLFFSDSLATTKLPVAVDAGESKWHAITAQYQPAAFPAFCDRAETMASFDLLTVPESGQKLLGAKAAFQALLIDVPRREKDSKYGCTRLLVELATKAIRDGHVACLVAKPKSKTAGAPKSVPQLLGRIVDAIEETAINFSLGCPACGLDAADFRRADSACATCKELRAVFALPDAAAMFEKEMLQTRDPDADRKAGDQRKNEADALRRAFVHIVEFARRLRPEARRESLRVVLLVDDLHAMAADAVAALLDHYLSSSGLRSARNQVRLVLGYCSAPQSGEESAVGAVKDWLGNVNWVEAITLDRFVGAEELAAYEHYLLHWEDPATRQPRPMTIASNNRESVLGMFRKRLEGVPSRLLTLDVVQTLLALDMNFLDDADDAAVLLKAGGNP